MDSKGRCCGRKPLVYKRDGYLFCFRCDKAYDINTKQQIENWAWMRAADGFVLRCTSVVHPIDQNRQAKIREWNGRPVGQLCDECFLRLSEDLKREDARIAGAKNKEAGDEKR